MNEGADIVAVCITCCTITGLVFGIAGLLFGRSWALKTGISSKCDDYEYDRTQEPDDEISLSTTSVRHRPNAVVAPSFL
tara:strand:+ start:432 stop:668 length:237 start_codon:yes stop_codon:yes gene_type:complete